ncbi:PA0069 family radical SAM protein [Mucilaginibacter arboris]|uniref:PA0069 family radical SAM protein n=1 Tax=Mucilaginibacter arboris TaxID=2682090 RepID=A0A7K1SSM5_9SPHI|nr:PA0069 family radical SAM protein [Mucilaginibacter arboris]MVN20244.1 PA0069 family radical SAM protein [Mucilaginibacter arboris]
MDQQENEAYFKGRGAQLNTHNKFLQNKYVREFEEGLDEPFLENSKTQFFNESPKNIVSESNSPDLSFNYSINPYQGCEHGCIYCYARNSHEYYGFSAGLDFERKIIVKHNAALLLEKYFNKKNYQPAVIALSGNTDCYQPIEKKLKITRSLLEVFLKYKHPISIITKNNLILRDIDLVEALARLDLIHVNVSITSLSEDLRLKLEPRTVTAAGRLNVIKKLSEAGVPVRVMVAPIIPGLNSHEITNIIKAAANCGARDAAYTIVRLNGSIGAIFTDWIYKAFPDQAEKVLHQIENCHGGKLNDSRWGTRKSGDGNIAASIQQFFTIACKKYLNERKIPPYNLNHFINQHGRQTELF